MAYDRDHVLTLEDFAKLPTSTVWGAIDEAYNAGTNPFRAAGVLTSSPLVQKSLTDGEGIRTEVQSWNDLEYVESNISNDDPEDHATPMKMDTKVWGAVRTHRNVGVSGMNLVQDFTGVDPLAALSSRIANYKNNDEVALLFAILDGLIKSDAANGKKITHTSADEDATLVDLLTAVQKLGDASSRVTAFGMSSATYLKYQIQNINGFTAPSATDTGFGRLANRDLIIDDRFGDRLVGMGAGLFHYASAPQARKSVAVESDESAGNGSGQDTIWFRWKNIVHPQGYDFTGTFASKGGPSFAELNTATAYTRVSDEKTIPLVIIEKPA